MNRDHLVRDIADHIEALTVRILIDERYLWSPRKEGLRQRQAVSYTETEIHDRKPITVEHNSHEWVEHEGPLPSKQPRRVSRKDAGLILQLANHTNDPFATSGSHEPVTGSKPDSRPPLDMDTLDTLERLTTMASWWRKVLCAETGRDLPKPAPVGADLAAIRGLALHPHTQLATLRTIERGLKSFINESLIRLSYNAPMVTLEYRCGDCGGDLRTRSDATSDPRCVGGDNVNPPWRIQGCGGSFPRYSWADLLTGTT